MGAEHDDETFGLKNPGNRLGLILLVVAVAIIVAGLLTGMVVTFYVASVGAAVGLIIMVYMLMKEKAEASDLE